MEVNAGEQINKGEASAVIRLDFVRREKRRKKAIG